MSSNEKYGNGIHELAFIADREKGIYRMNIQKHIEFTVGFSYGLHDKPQKWIPATVPGAVQLDWAKEHDWKPYYHGENWSDYKWMEDCFWHYQAHLDVSESFVERVFLYGKGIDYHYVIQIDGMCVCEREGMFSPFEVDLTAYKGMVILLEITIYPVPKKHEEPDDRSQASDSCKAAVSYGWDWHPRLIPLGIWDDVYLEYRSTKHIQNAELFYELSEDFQKAYIHFLTTASTPAYEYWFQIYDQAGKIVFEKRDYHDEATLHIDAELENVDLWWPNGYGNPTLYQVKLQLLEDNQPCDEWLSRVGFRKAELVMYPNGWDEPKHMPKSRSMPPITMQMNGKDIFCKGSNWVQPEVFYGLIDQKKYQTLLMLAKNANCNMLRSWGGGIINKDVFFDICDELGLMIWQEFPLACNEYCGTSHYLRVLDAESRSIIQRIRRHACLVLWCGGNELFNAWSRMTDQSSALRLLNKNCYELDPHTPFIMTSPLSGMAHGGYVFRDEHGEEVYQIMKKAENTAYTEFSCPSISEMEILKLALPTDEITNPSALTSWETHHGFGAWGDQRWAELDTLRYYFGDLPTIEEKIVKSNLLQSEGLKAIFEEARKQQPKCSMALNWCYCESWPTAAGNHIVDWNHRPKQAYYAVTASLRNTLISARNDRFLWKENETFEAELWVLNDAFENVEIGEITALLVLDSKEYELLKWTVPIVAAQHNIKGPVACMQLPFAQDGEMQLKLLVDQKPQLNSQYVFWYKHCERDNTVVQTPIMNM